jgi:hypothetical protein
MKIARIICLQLDSTLRPTMNDGIDMSRALALPSKTIAPQQKRLFSLYATTDESVCHKTIAVFPVPNSWSIAIYSNPK